MKTLSCPRCNKPQSGGIFCLDCGTKLMEVINTKIEFAPIKSSRSADGLKRDIKKWLERIGVTDITFRSSNESVTVEYLLNHRKYGFTSVKQYNLTNNFAAVEQFLHSRVLGIERGIETTEQAFAGYEQLPDYSVSKQGDPYQTLGFSEKVDIETARTKFRKLIKMYHPDLNPNKGTHEEFTRLKKAMDTIEAQQ